MKTSGKILLFIFTLTTSLHAQKLTITSIEFVKDKINVHYTLDDVNSNHQYNVDLYSSKDNFISPLTKVSGDVGAEIKPGELKKIEWNILQELGNYSGNLTLELRAKVFVPVAKLSSFDLTRKYKRGKTYPLLWKSGDMGGQVDIDLYNGKERINSDRNIPNTGKYEWMLPGSVKPGNEYYLRFTNTRNREDYVVTGPFRVVPRTPFIVKAGIVTLAGAAVAILTSGGQKPTGEEPGLPVHPGLPPN